MLRLVAAYRALFCPHPPPQKKKPLIQNKIALKSKPDKGDLLVFYNQEIRERELADLHRELAWARGRSIW